MKKSMLILSSILLISILANAQTKEYPIQVQLISTPTIINDGSTANTLEIGVFNNVVSAAAPNFTFRKDKPLYFWFIVSPSMPSDNKPYKPFALTTIDRIGTAGNAPQSGATRAGMSKGEWKILVSTPLDDKTSIQRGDLAGWKVIPKNDVVLKPGEYLTFTISNLVTSMADGYTMAYFLYDIAKYNEVNYRSWYSFGPVSKSSYYSGKRMLGIGTSNPTAQVEVQSDRSTELVLKTGNGQMDTSETFTVSRDARMALGLAKPGPFRLSLKSSNNYAANADAQILHIAPDLSLLNGNKPAGNLLKFGADGDYQFKSLSQGFFKTPTLAFNAGAGTSIGFYNGDTANLEINSATGNTYIKGMLGIGGNPQSTLEVWGDLVVKNENGDMLFSVAKDGIVRFSKPLSVKGSSVLGEQIMVPYGTLDDWNVLMTSPLVLPATVYCAFDENFNNLRAFNINGGYVTFTSDSGDNFWTSTVTTVSPYGPPMMCPLLRDLKFDYLLVRK